MLRPEPNRSIPEETVRVARAAFPKGNVYMQMQDELGRLYEDEAFRSVFSRLGQPAVAPWRLAWVTVMQFAEGLTDRQAADAVRGRIDWKYVLGLDLADPGFDHTVLSEFRTRLVDGEGEAYLLDRLLQACQARGWLKARCKQRTDSTHVLAAIHTLHRLELVGQTLQAALNDLAQVAPTWLKSWVPGVWFERYGRKLEEYRLPKTATERMQLAHQIGQDGWGLLDHLDKAETLPALRERQSVTILRQVWTQHYERKTDGSVRWLDKPELLPSAQRLASPHDPDARSSTKRDVGWTGYKAHFTETCDDKMPHLVTHVETTLATTADNAVLDTIHQALAARDLLPSQHIVDSGYMSADQLVRSQTEYDVDLIGPLRPDVSWQAQTEHALDASHFQIDWETHQVTCPAGHRSQAWTERTGFRGQPGIVVQFRNRDCRPCSLRALCTRRQSGSRLLAFPPQALFAALQAARQRQATPAFQALYDQRAGIEGTLSQVVHVCAARQTRYIGLAKTHLQYVVTAVALNFKRLFAWLNGETRAQTRRSPFAALA
jgi:transposase